MENRISFIIKYIFRKVVVQLGFYSKPDFLIVGAQKSGTSALFGILKQHSKISGAIRKEIHFFDDDKNFPCKNYNSYHSFFPFPNRFPENNLLFEATPSYIYNSNAAERIYNYNKDLKIIICLRNPVKRVLSAWTMFHYGFKNHERYSHLFDERTFPEVIDEELQALNNGLFGSVKPPYIQTGIYHYQIEKYFSLFPRENILILEHEELKTNHDETVKTICNFLNIPNESLPQLQLNVSVKENRNDYENQLSVLKDFYKPYNEKLFELIGKRYNW